MGIFNLNTFKLIVGLFGFVLCVAGMWYLIDFLSRFQIMPHLLALSRLKLLGLLLLVLCLTLSYVPVALSWRAILGDCGTQISARKAQLIFSISNLGKYAPGNLLHMAGRQVLAMREGVPTLGAVKSLLIETVLLALTSALFAAAFWFISSFGDIPIFICISVLCFIFLVCVLALRHFGFPGSSSAIIRYGVYHMLGGIVFVMLFFILSDNSKTFDLSFIFFLISAYVASWFIGFITPGAPAGLGVKEAVLLGLLNSVVPDEAVLGAAVLLSRGMNILSDLLYFLVLHGLNLRSLRALSSREVK
jgi:uncharacterized membrane protein YbhN (UPF0104 family)